MNHGRQWLAPVYPDRAATREEHVKAALQAIEEICEDEIMASPILLKNLEDVINALPCPTEKEIYGTFCDKADKGEVA